MSNVAKLKKEAADLEQKKQFEKALKVYAKLLSEFERYPQEIDVALFNRVGDIQVKLGQVAEGVDTYEKAVDHYAEGGFFNNAIAMCNKILRQAPGRASVYYKLGKISAQKGFKAEARQNFLEYADRMEKGGKTDEAFRALMEFLELVPDQDDIRSMLADQLTKAKRNADALEQLQTLYERYSADGNLVGADSAAERIRAIDPKVELRSSSDSHESSGGDLIFLDLDAPSTRPTVEPEPAPPPPRAPANLPSKPAGSPVSAPAASTLAPEPLAPEPLAPEPLAPETLAPEPEAPEPEAPEPEAPMEITRASDAGDAAGPESAHGGLEIESTSLGGPDDGVAIESLNIEPTSFGEVSLDAPPPTRPIAADPPVVAPAPAVVPPLPPIEEEMSLADIPPMTVPETELLDFGTAELPVVEPVKDDAPRSSSGGGSLEFLDLTVSEPEGNEVARDSSPPPVDLSAAPIFEIPEPKAQSSDLDLGDFAPAPASPTPSRPAPPPRPAAAVPDFDLSEVATPAPRAPRMSTVFSAKAINLLSAAVQASPENWSLRREWAEAMLEAGDRAGGIAELETAMNGAENFDDLELAMAIAEELGKLEPQVVKHHQKRVEYAFRRNDRPRLVEAYLTLAGALMQNEQSEKARAVYQRVLELAPDNMQAQAAVETLAPPAAAAAAPPPARSSTTAKRPSAAKPVPPPAKKAAVEDTGFVNLGDWLREDEGPKDTRMVVDEKEPTGDENADFADMLKKFKQGVADNVDAEDYQSHYDLAIAFREMGLLDEAIAGFQRALGSKTNRLPTYEALGECFIEKGQPKMAAAILQRGIAEQKATDEQLVGVLYLLGRAAEAQEQPGPALDYYQRVFVIDIQFRDVADRMSAVEKAAR